MREVIGGVCFGARFVAKILKRDIVVEHVTCINSQGVDGLVA